MALLNVPHCLLTSLLSEWVDIKDVVYVDSAVCNKDLRKHYLHALSSPGFRFGQITVGESKSFQNESLIDWICNRQILVKEVIFKDVPAFQLFASKNFDHDIKLQSIEMNLYDRGMQVNMNLMKHFMQSCSSLRHLCCHQVFNSLVDDDIVAMCGQLPLLESLRISNATELTNSGVAKLAYVCPSLHSIGFFQCKHIHPTCIYSLLVHLPKLAHVTFESCYGRNIVFRDDTSLDKCPNLLSFTLKYAWYVDEESLLTILSMFPNLETLVLRGCSISQNTILLISQWFTQLKHLDLTATTTFSDHYLHQPLIQPWSQLSSLQLSYCKEITDVGLTAIGQLCPALTRLSLQHCQGITDMGILSLTKSLLELEELDLRQCYALSNASLQAIVHCTSWKPRLRKLFLSDCKRLSDSAILNLFQHHQYFNNNMVSSPVTGNKHDTMVSILEVLDMEGCHGVTDVGISLLGYFFPCLKDVSFARCAGITSHGLSSLLHSLAVAASPHMQRTSTKHVCSPLQVLNINRSVKAVSSVLINAILKYAPNLRSLDASYCFGTLQSPEAMAALASITTATRVSLRELNVTGGTFMAQTPQSQYILKNLKERGIRVQIDETNILPARSPESGPVDSVNCVPAFHMTPVCSIASTKLY